MLKQIASRRLLLQAFLGASALGGAAQAQQGAAVAVSDAAMARNVIQVPCCKCVDGSVQKIDISTGGSAPWQVSSGIPGLTGPWPMTPGAITNPHPAWGAVTAALAPARWLQPSSATTMQNFANGPSTFTLRINVPRCTIPMKVTIQGQVASDDAGKLWLDGTTISGTTGFGAPLPFSATLSPGMHVLRMEVANQGGGPTGMILKGTLVKQCSKNLFRQEGREEAVD